MEETKMKRFLVLTSAMVLTLSMAACADKQTTPPPSSSDPNSSVTQQQPSGSDKNPGGSTQQNSTAPTTKTGVGVVISLENSWGATADKPAGARTEVTVCAASFEKDGKIASVRFDAAEPGVDFDAAGALTTDLTIKVSSAEQRDDQTFIFNVAGVPDTDTAGVNLTVTVKGNGSTTITDIPTGDYIVTELTDWSWRYENDTAQRTVTLVYDASQNVVTYDNTREKDKWLDGNASLLNKF
jgi:hypothetical protein